MPADAIVILEEDHKRIRDLFRQFEAAVAAFDAPAPALAPLTRLHDELVTRRKGTLLNRILRELTVHRYIENESMYHQVRRLAPDLEDDVLESYEEHHESQLNDIGQEMLKLKREGPLWPLQPSALRRALDAIIR